MLLASKFVSVCLKCPFKRYRKIKYTCNLKKWYVKSILSTFFTAYTFRKREIEDQIQKSNIFQIVSFWLLVFICCLESDLDIFVHVDISTNISEYGTKLGACSFLNTDACITLRFSGSCLKARLI